MKTTDFTEKRLTTKAQNKRKYEIRSSFFRVLRGLSCLRGKASVFSVPSVVKNLVVNNGG